jgi:hypothetical protein
MKSLIHLPQRRPIKNEDNLFHRVFGKRLEQEGKLVSTLASEIMPKNIDWLWPGRIAIGKQTILGGEPDNGKSQVATGIAATISVGGSWPNGEGQAPLGSVIILSAEDDDEDTMVPRLIAAGADLSRIHLVRAVRGAGGRQLAFNFQTDLAALEEKIWNIGDVRLVIVDPISSYLGTRINSHNNAEVRSVLEPISEMAADAEVGVLAITHSPKGTGMKAIDRFVGSIGFVAQARSAYIVTKDPSDAERRLMLPVKNNIAAKGQSGLAYKIEGVTIFPPGRRPIETSRVVWDGYATVGVNEALVASDTLTDGGTQFDKAEAFLRDLLKDGALSVAEIEQVARMEGISERTLRRAKGNLHVRSRKDGLQGPWMWELSQPTD